MDKEFKEAHVKTEPGDVVAVVRLETGTWRYEAMTLEEGVTLVQEASTGKSSILSVDLYLKLKT